MHIIFYALNIFARMNEPEYYCPGNDEHSNYVDRVPPIAPPGIRCPCNNSKLYKTRIQFSAHIKTKSHQGWLQSLNLHLKERHMV